MAVIAIFAQAHTVPPILLRAMGGATVSMPVNVVLDTMNGSRKIFAVANLETTLAEVQRDVLTLFEKPYPTTWASLTVGSDHYASPDSKPFLSVSEGDVLKLVFQNTNFVRINFTSEGKKTKTLTVQRNVSLRDVQHMLCSAFHERFPLMCASLNVGGDRFDDFNDYPGSWMKQDHPVYLVSPMQPHILVPFRNPILLPHRSALDKPFVNADDNGEIQIHFETTSDMYFFDLIDRRQPSPDPCEVPELSLEIGI